MVRYTIYLSTLISVRVNTQRGNCISGSWKRDSEPHIQDAHYDSVLVAKQWTNSLIL